MGNSNMWESNLEHMLHPREQCSSTVRCCDQPSLSLKGHPTTVPDNRSQEVGKRGKVNEFRECETFATLHSSQSRVLSVTPVHP